MTRCGQLAAIIYGLIGIPLAVLVAIDIGRFLSDILISGWRMVCFVVFVERKLY